MVDDHAALVATAQELFPGSTLVATRTHEDFKRDLYALYKEAWSDLPQVDRLHEGLRNVYRGMATTGHPWWGQVAAEIEAALERL